MARKLGFDAGMAFLACALLAGCETGNNSRLANNTTPGGGSLAKQGSLPPPTPATPSNTGGFRTTSGNGSGGFSTATANNAFTGSLPSSPNTPANFSPAANNPAPPNLTPLNTNTTSNNLSGPQTVGAGSTNNRVVTTQPAPELPSIVPPPPTTFTTPGISSIPQLPQPQ
jgi:hypothetical protein